MLRVSRIWNWASNLRKLTHGWNCVFIKKAFFLWSIHKKSGIFMIFWKKATFWGISKILFFYHYKKSHVFMKTAKFHKTSVNFTCFLWIIDYKKNSFFMKTVKRHKKIVFLMVSSNFCCFYDFCLTDCIDVFWRCGACCTAFG